MHYNQPDTEAKHAILKSYAELYGRRLSELAIDLLCEELKEYESGMIKSALRIYSGKEENKTFPTIPTIKAYIRLLVSDVKPGFIPETACMHCHGKGYIEAEYSMFGYHHYSALFKCHCPNGERSPELPLMPQGEVDRVLTPHKTVRVPYRPVVKQDMYSPKLVTKTDIWREKLKLIGRKMI